MIISAKNRTTTNTPHVYDVNLEPGSNRAEFFASNKIVNQSAFFRLKNMYTELSEIALPLWESASSVQVWSVGCADGREPFSIGMFLMNWLKQMGKSEIGTLWINAIDINPEMVTIARGGRFRVNRGEKRDLAAYSKYFTSFSGNEIEISEALRRVTSFKVRDVLEVMALRHYDLIVCSNVLFYYESDFRTAIVKHLMNFLRPNGLIYMEGLGNRAAQQLGIQRVKPRSHFFELSGSA